MSDLESHVEYKAQETRRHLIWATFATIIVTTIAICFTVAIIHGQTHPGPGRCLEGTAYIETDRGGWGCIADD